MTNNNSGERMQFTAYLDPNDRCYASVTNHGGQSSFINKGDMYVMAARYIEYLTNGAITFISKDTRTYFQIFKELSGVDHPHAK